MDVHIVYTDAEGGNSVSSSNSNWDHCIHFHTITHGMVWIYLEYEYDEVASKNPERGHCRLF